MSIVYYCKVCHRQSEAPQAVDASVEWEQRLAPLLTCDRCYDRRERYQTATELIRRSCYRLHRARSHESPDAVQVIIGKTRQLLIVTTQAYARVMAEYRRLDEPVWTPDFVEQLLEMPDLAWQTLKDYRTSLASARQAQQELV